MEGTTIENEIRTGSVAELAVASRLVELGYTVGWPLNTSRYDLLVEKDGRVRRIQVKGANISPRHSYRFGVQFGSKGNRRTYKKKDCDFIVFYAPYSKDFPDLVEDGFYVVPVSALGGRAMVILFPAGKGRGNVRLCSWEKYKDGWKSI